MSKKIDVNVIEYFGAHAGEYDSPQNVSFYADLTSRLCGAAAKFTPEPASIIEIGCGSGISTSEIMRRFPRASLTAIEPAAQLLDKAIKRAGRAASFINCRLLEFNHNAKADLLIGNMSFHWLSEEEVSGLATKTAPGGLVALSIPLKRVGSSAVFENKFLGNRLLLDAYRAVMKGETAVRIPRRWRGIVFDSFSIPELQTVAKDIFEIVEEPAADIFIKTIASRGLLLALFGDKAAEALAWIKKRLPSGGKVPIGWPIGIFVGKNGGRVTGDG